MSSFEAIAQIVFKVLLTRLKCRNFQRARTQGKKIRFFFFSSAGHLLIIPYEHIKFQYNISNCFLDILLTKFHCIFERDITQERDITMIRKKYGPFFFYEKSIYEISKTNHTRFKSYAMYIFEISLLQG